MQVTFNTQTDDLNDLLNVLSLLREAINKKQQQNQPIQKQENQQLVPILQQVPNYGFKPEENMGVASAIGNLVQDLNKEKENSRLAVEGFFMAPKPIEIPKPIIPQPPTQQIQQPLQQVQEPKKTPEKTTGGGRVIPFIDLSSTMGKIFSSDYGTKKEGRRV